MAICKLNARIQLLSTNKEVMILLSASPMTFGHWQRTGQLWQMCNAEICFCRCVRETLQERYRQEDGPEGKIDNIAKYRSMGHAHELLGFLQFNSGTCHLSIQNLRPLLSSVSCLPLDFNSVN